MEAKTILESTVYPYRKTHIYIEHIIPTTVVKDKNAYEITHIDSSLYIHGFAITTYTKEDSVACINLFGDHPNANPNTNAYCLPDHKKYKNLNNKFLNLLHTNFKTYYYDDAYFIPDTKLVEYKKLNSMYIQFNEGETHGTVTHR